MKNIKKYQEKCIEMKQVSFQYENGKKESIKDVNLTIHKGECVLLCGKSGYGKTTITKLINGLIPYCETGEKTGEVLVLGKPVEEQPLYELSKVVSSVFQNPKSQFFNVEPESELAFALENENMPGEQITQRIEQVVQELGIESLMHKNLFQMSGGEKQMIAIGSAYAADPEIIVLDEPSANLDIETIKVLTGILEKIKAAGKTIVIAEHRLSYLEPILDTVYYLDEGRILERFSKEAFFQIDTAKRKEMGLRNLDMHHRFSCKRKAVSLGVEKQLSLRNVHIAFEKKTLFENIGLELKSGQIVALTGKNGRGKTTLSRVICGLEKHGKGEILWNGARTKPKQRKRFSYVVMQDVNHQLFAESVEEECFLGNEGVTQEEIETVLESLMLSEQAKSHPQCLSGGQKQRLAVAVALLAQKDILLFDEPTSGLDYCNMRNVGGILRKLANQGKVVLVVTHDLEFIEEVCDCCYCLNQEGIRDISKEIRLG